MEMRDRVEQAEDHPIRGSILDALIDTELTSRDLVKEIPRVPSTDDAASLGQVNYHCAVLEQAGLVERIGGLWRLP